MEEKNTNQTQNAGGQEQMKLDDARRVKSMSPTQMVMKRFMRNKLAITGTIIIVVMFIFSFIGPLFIPYTEAQVFKGMEYMVKDYAGAAENNDLVFYAGGETDSAISTAFKKALGQGETAFSSNGVNYTFAEIGDNIYEIYAAEQVASVTAKGRLTMYTPEDGFEITDDFKKAFEKAKAANETSFTYDKQEYVISSNGNITSIGIADTAGYAAKWLFDVYDISDTIAKEYSFQAEVIKAFAEEKDSFELDGEIFHIIEEDGYYLITSETTETIRAMVSNMKMNAKASDIQLSGEFKEQLREAIQAGESSFTDVDENGEEIEYTLRLNNGTWLVRANMPTEMRRSYEGPSKEHLLGLDGNGMDVMTRLMYGGRVSLLVGFVVVILEIVIGVIVGGISGFFGGVIDTFLMRFVDLFNSIPFWPMVLIFGSVMDQMELSSTTRLFLLMALLGILNWTGIARVVRGQILSLREQDFMVATEATGIRISRRIFRHLVPNVMPLLIVQATMSLGSIILTEATMSFLGLGVKYPMASWGSIINAANDIHIMSNYWFIWLPAGLLIMLTVLGFNFVGDGLRDAFDPRMKR